MVARCTALLAAALLAFAGCGSPEPGTGPTADSVATTSEPSPEPAPTSTTPEPPAGPPDPCELVTDEEAAAAGVTVSSRELLANPASPVVPTERICIILDSVDRYITVHVSEGGQADYDLFRDQHAIEADFRELDGLGDAAHSIRSEAVVLVGIYVARYNLQLYEQGVDPATQQDRVIALATAGTAKIT
jgi:hypothetical protein